MSRDFKSMKPDDIGEWTYIAIVVWCTFLAVFKTAWIILTHPLTWKQIAEDKKQGGR